MKPQGNTPAEPVLLTGATGFVGQAVARRLHEAGYRVRILARRDSPRSQHLVKQFGAEVHPGDVTEPASLAGALANISAVVHLVGIISEVGASTFENVHTRGTRNLVAAAQMSGVRRFVHMSALGTRPQAESRYHQTKWAAEEAVRQSGLDYTIFRPSLIYGPGDHFVNLFAGMSRLSPVLPVLGRARFQPVAVEAVATAFVQALVEPQSIGQTYDLCGPDTLTLSQIIGQILQVTGRKRLQVPLPLGLARWQAAALEWVYPALLRQAPPLNRDQLLMLQEDNIGNAEPANQLFGLKHESFRQGIARYLGVKREA